MGPVGLFPGGYFFGGWSPTWAGNSKFAVTMQICIFGPPRFEVRVASQRCPIFRQGAETGMI